MLLDMEIKTFHALFHFDARKLFQRDTRRSYGFLVESICGVGVRRSMLHIPPHCDLLKCSKEEETSPVQVHELGYDGLLQA